MEIMCLNGWGGKLHEVLLPYLNTATPDVLCLQEVVHSPTSDKDWLTYRDGDHVLPQRANLFRDVCRVLPDHHAIFCPHAQGTLWDGEMELPSQFGIATFVHKSLTIIGQTQGFVHKDYSPNGYGSHPRSRNAHGVRVYDDNACRAVSITHMHGLRDLRGKMDTPDRARQAQKFLDVNQQLSQSNDISVLCGDFNLEPESETLTILATAGFTELVKAHAFPTTRTSFYKKSDKFADYMLINSFTAVKKFEVINKTEVSDHCPLFLHI
jgi:endonuclease/exonuclease/phosphatase family metal-dependent hydrolase